LQTIARWIVLIAVLFSPWLFGSAEPWAYLSICILINIALAIWIVHIMREGYIKRFSLISAGLGILLLGYMFFQIMPLPRHMAHIFSPLSAEAQQTLNQIMIQFGETGSAASTHYTISISPSATFRSIFLLTACLSIFLVITGSIGDRGELKRITLIIVISGFVMAIFAMIQDFTGTRLIYWFHQPRLGGTIFGPFTNRNHFAAYMNMSLGATLALLLAGSHTFVYSRQNDWREKLSFISHRNTNWMIMLGYSAVLMGSAVFLSLSRGGITSLVAALGLVGLFAMRRYRHIQRRGLLITLGLCVAAMVFWLGWEPVFNRLNSLSTLATDPLRDTRWLATKATLQAWGAAPITGCGFGAFQHLFPLFQISALQFGRFVYAHNDYAQLLAEGGVIGAFLVTYIVVIFVLTAKAYRQTAIQESKLFTLGLSVGLIAIIIHSLVDFSLHRPANLFLFSLLLALGMAALRIPGQGRDYLYESGPVISMVRVFCSIALVLLLLITLVELRQLRGEFAFARFVQWCRIAEKSTTIGNRQYAIEEAGSEADLTLQSGPNNPDALLEVMVRSLRYAADRNLPPEQRIRLSEQAKEAGLLAVHAAPSDYEYWLWLAHAQRVAGEPLHAKISLGRANDLAPPGMNAETHHKF